MIFATFIFAAMLRYESILTKYDKPVFQSGASRYELYAEGDVGGGRKVVVYGFTPVRRGSSPDIDHQIFVTMIGRKGDAYELVSGRRDVTDSVFNIGERGRFTDFRARVNVFTLRKGYYVDVQLWSSIGGTGGISSANDVIYRIARDGALVIAAKLDVTEEFSRNGWREIRETSSNLAVGENSLVWTKKERLGSRDKAETPFHVNCQTTRTTYRPHGRSLVAEPPAAATKDKLTPLGRVPLKEIVPCCSGCELKE
ncbi:MAG TPA: hypothetical protein VF505_15515 [Thermoanaerobaculia bacterium]